MINGDRQWTWSLMVLAAAAVSAQAESYSDAVMADQPLVYLPLGGATPESVAVNEGSLGATLNGVHHGVEYRDLGALDASANPSVYYAGGAYTSIPYQAALNPAASESFTIEAWLRPDETGLSNAQSPLFNRRSAGNRQGWVFFQRAPGEGWNFRMYAENGGSVSIDITGGSYTVGWWSHVAMVWDGSTSTANLYVDGVLVGSQTGAYVPNSEGPLSVGAYGADAPGDNPFIGGVDEVAFYPSALSSQQINAHIDNAWTLTPEVPYADLVAEDGATLYLRMNEYAPWRSVAENRGSLGGAGNGVHFPGVTHQVPGALAGDDNPAMRFAMIDASSADGGYPTVIPGELGLNSESFSWEGWVKPLAEGLGNAQCLVKNHEPNGNRTGWVIWQRASNEGSDQGGGFGWNLRLYNGNGNQATINLTSGSGAGGYTLGEWQHLAVTYSSATQTAVMYVNGVEAASQGVSAGAYLTNLPGQLSVGLAGFPNGSENAFAGDLDEVAFYDKVLSAGEVADRYANGMNASREVSYESLIEASDPVVYYRLDEAAVSVEENLGSLGESADGFYVQAPEVIAGPDLPIFEEGAVASRFDGESTFVELRNPEGLNLSGEITLEAWIRPDAEQLQSSATIVGHGGNDNFAKEVFLRIENGQYEVGATGGKASFAIPTEDLTGEAWVHLAGTWKDGEWTLYRNGVGVATGEDGQGAVAIDNANWSVGSRGRWKYGQVFPDAVDPGALRVFSGGIGSAAIFDSALSEERIQAHFSGAAGMPPGLMLFRNDGVITLEWSGGTLQESEDLKIWTDRSEAVSPYLPEDGSGHFYRLRY
ncbi:hypothetical protein HNR46_000399 [Haloferula luteola]|uniref:LamG-like jellyroll fold domain-containing protein n=1 Tax=Haloferula luteola TaxID=595692 RepID=A0A840V5W4_9BACT|nr:LamG domain-containing protein [Haloferula luteola]MBB5350178.1 hypothetical protein [Haloferula luteola]